MPIRYMASALPPRTPRHWSIHGKGIACLAARPATGWQHINWLLACLLDCTAVRMPCCAFPGMAGCPHSWCRGIQCMVRLYGAEALIAPAYLAQVSTCNMIDLHRTVRLPMHPACCMGTVPSARSGASGARRCRRTGTCMLQNENHKAPNA